jgi:hypothetical protein
MSENWWSIEILDAESPGYLTADLWRDVYSAALIEAAITHGANDWGWIRTDFGVVFEVSFEDPEVWSTFRNLPVVRAALDAAPDPINGIMIYPGRGGGALSRVPRRPRPIPASGAAPLPVDPELLIVHRDRVYLVAS